MSNSVGNPLVNIIKEEWKHLGKRKRIFAFYLLLFVLAGTISLMTPLVIGLIFNSVQENISSMQELRNLIIMIFLLLAIRIGFWILHGPARFLETITGFKIYQNYNNRKIGQVLELPTKWHKDNHSGDTIDKVKRGGDAVANFSQNLTYDIVYSLINVFGSVIILFFFSKLIAGFALLFSIVVLTVIFLMDRKLIEYYKSLNKKSNELGAAIFDYISNIITIITLRLKKTVAKRIDEKIENMYIDEKKASALNECKWAFASISLSVMTVLALSYYSYNAYVTTGVIMIGTLYILYGYLNQVGQTFYQFASLYGRIVRLDARIRGAYPIEEAYDEVVAKEKIEGSLPKNWEEIEIRNLDFTYDLNGGQQHMDNATVKFKRGQKIAFIGESGSGKSTILALMRGLYEPQKGDVYVDGQKLKNGFEKLKGDITLIPQEPEIFNNTLKYNITMDLKARRDDVAQAIKMAQFEKVVNRLEKGLDTSVLEKGVSLSGGEKQRLALARGLLAAKKGEIVLMDEPTSSVDSMNEIKIHDNIFKAFKDKTIMSSIHRLHLLDKFDYIYMFDQGKVIAHGTLEEMQKNTQFKRMMYKYRVGKKRP